MTIKNVNVDQRNIEIDITHDHRELNEWVEQIGKTANEICNDPDGNRIKLNEQHTGYIMESNDAGALGCLGWAIERHINDIHPTFRKILEDTRHFIDVISDFIKRPTRVIYFY